LVESKEHLGGPVAWMNPLSTEVETWCREVDNFKWTTLRVVWSKNKDGRF
jgi:hypothetical protein